MNIICSHFNCDLDALASMIAAKLLFPDAKLCLAGAADITVRQLIKDYPGRFDIIKERAINLKNIKSVIMVDNSNYERTGKIGEYLINNPEVPVICFDHHPPKLENHKFLYYRYEAYGACTTILIKEIIERGITIDPLTASFLALGIYSDTGSFKAINTSSEDFSALAYLINMGASISFINSYLQPQLNTKEIQLMNKLVSTMEVLDFSGIQVHFFDIILENEIYNIAKLLQIIRQSENIKCLFAFVILPDKTIIIGRSDFLFIQVNTILSEYNGGGHLSSGSATVHNIPPDIIKKRIHQLIHDSIIKHGTVASIMTKDVETATVKTKIYEVGKKLSNQNFGAIPILKDKKVVGIVTKKDVGQAVLHKLSAKTVDNIMSTDIISVNSNTSIYKAQETLIRHNIGRLLVIDNDKKGQPVLIGIVSRRDIIKATFEQQVEFSEGSFDNASGYLKKINNEILKVINHTGAFADILGINAWLVGGFVRDLIMNKENVDIDIVIEGDAIEFSKALSDRFNLPTASFPQFRTAIVVFNTKNNKNIKIDFASARSEIYDKPGILPAVKMSSIKNDLYRRDFTINSMAIQINQKFYGRLFDYYNGRKDIQTKTIKTLNNMSFSDDPTRILRAVRFEQRYQFEIDKNTKHLITAALDLKLLKRVSVERITQELVKACEDEHVHRFFSRLKKLKILYSINPNLTMNKEKENQMETASRMILWYQESFTNKSIKNWLIYMCILTKDMTKRSAEKFFQQYKFPLQLKKSFNDYICIKAFFCDNLSTTTRGEVAWHLKKINHEVLLALASNSKHKEIIDYIKNFLLYDSSIKTELNGHDIINLGEKDGKVIAKILQDLYISKIDKKFLTKEDELNYIKNKYNYHEK